MVRGEQNKQEDYASSNLALSTKALQLNPELYTAWNYRRLIFLHSIFPESFVPLPPPSSLPCLPCFAHTASPPRRMDRSRSQVLTYLLDDLNMTTVFLKNLPKVYWIWTHRRWCLDNIPSGPAPGLAEDRSKVEEDKGEGDEKEERKEGEKNWDGTWKKEGWERELKLVEKMLSVDARNCASCLLPPSHSYIRPMWELTQTS
jgi:geranylgeranyl transferase type-2 subunit alpha